MLWMMPAAWRNLLPGVRWRARKTLSEGRLVVRMNKFTLLDDAVWAFLGLAGRNRIGQASRRQHFVGAHDACGERRLLFGAGEDPAEAGVGSEQDREIGISQRLGKVAEWVKSGSVVTC